MNRQTAILFQIGNLTFIELSTPLIFKITFLKVENESGFPGRYLSDNYCTGNKTQNTGLFKGWTSGQIHTFC